MHIIPLQIGVDYQLLELIYQNPGCPLNQALGLAGRARREHNEHRMVGGELLELNLRRTLGEEVDIMHRVANAADVGPLLPIADHYDLLNRGYPLGDLGRIGQ